jgi:ABC-type spermidine/putrescine transport system permease subunit II
MIEAYQYTRQGMNRPLYIIVVPVLLVALGYIFVFRHIGLALGYPRLIVSLTVFFTAAWWLMRRAARKPKSSQQ